MIIIGGDIETTGLQPGDHRIIEVYLETWNLETRACISQFHQRYHPQRSIPVESQRIHGMTLADLDGQPVWDRSTAQIVADYLNSADVLVFHNGSGFDLPFINYELVRVGIEPTTASCFDTMLEGRWATPYGKAPSLQELCFATDTPYDPTKAHKADYDVTCMMQAFFKGVDWDWFRPRRTKTEALEVSVAA